MGDLLRRYWLPAMLAEELPAPDCPPVRLTLLSEQLVAFRDTSGRVGLLEAHCPHRGTNLFWGRNEENGLRCVYHGWKFDVTGACVDMPNEPAASNFKAKLHAVAYQAREAGGMIWVYMGPPELTPEMPQLEWTLVPESHRYVHKRIQYNNYLQNVEGEVDSAHVSFLHRSFGEALPMAGQRLLSQQTDSAPHFSVRESDQGLLIGARRTPDDDTYYWRITQFLMPTYTMIPAEIGELVNFTAAVPIDDERMWGYTVAWHPDRPLTEEEIARIESWRGVYTELTPGTYESALTFANDYGIDREKQRTESFTGIRGIREQDLPVQEDQWGPVSNRTREHLGTTDLAIIAMRRKLLQTLRGLQEGVEPREAHNGASYHVRSAAFIAPQSAVWYEVPEADVWMSPRA
jgi:phenylpropionate dioxygenase-like ring-hydroxylating dioxygenase large terminal subunit